MNCNHCHEPIPPMPALIRSPHWASAPWITRKRRADRLRLLVNQYGRHQSGRCAPRSAAVRWRKS